MQTLIALSIAALVVVLGAYSNAPAPPPEVVPAPVVAEVAPAPVAAPEGTPAPSADPSAQGG